MSNVKADGRAAALVLASVGGALAIALSAFLLPLGSVTGFLFGMPFAVGVWGAVVALFAWAALAGPAAARLARQRGAWVVGAGFALPWSWLSRLVQR